MKAEMKIAIGPTLRRDELRPFVQQRLELAGFFTTKSPIGSVCAALEDLLSQHFGKASTARVVVGDDLGVSVELLVDGQDKPSRRENVYQLERPKPPAPVP